MPKKDTDILSEALEIADNIDGFRLIEYQEDGVYLSVHGPEGNGKSINLNELLEELSDRKIVDVDEKLVREIVSSEEAKPIKIAPPQEEVKRDGYAKVEASKDKLKAYLTVFPPLGGKPFSFEQCIDKIKESGINFGINYSQVKSALGLSEVSEPVLIVEGVPPVDGDDAEIDYKFRTDKVKLTPKQYEDGTIDYYNLDLIQNVRAGEVLAIKKPLTEGTAGKNIYGEVIPSKPGKDKLLVKGKNVDIVDNGLMALATESGQVMLKEKKISVIPVYEHQGDVDFSSGNLTFVGTIIVRGSVKNGFKVCAEGDVEILQSVEGGNVSAGGSISIKNGIQGRGKSLIQTDRDLFSKFIENATVVAKENITTDVIMHSKITAGKSVNVTGKKGLLVGGHCCVGESITARIIGSNLGTFTNLEIGVNPELRKKYNAIVEEMKKTSNDIDKAVKAINLLKKISSKQNLSTDKKAMLMKLSRAHSQLRQKLEQIKDQKVESEQRITEHEQGFLKVSGILFPGVKLVIGQSVKHIIDECRTVYLSLENGEIRETSHK